MNDEYESWCRYEESKQYKEASKKIKDRIEELETALKACHYALNVAFEFDGDVFGIHHNAAVDADILAHNALGTWEGKR